MKTSKYIVYTDVPRPPSDVIAKARNCSVADLVEAMHLLCGKASLLPPEIRPISPRAHAVGPAITAFNQPGDNLMTFPALETAQRGDFLVLSSGGSVSGPIFGDTTGTECLFKGIAGCVADGAVRDLAFMYETGFPLWARHISPSHPEKNVPGMVNMPISIGGVIVEPGDLIVADSDGVIVVPNSRAGEIVNLAVERKSADDETRRKIKGGESVLSIKGLRRVLEEKGVVEVQGTWLDATAGS